MFWASVYIILHLNIYNYIKHIIKALFYYVKNIKNSLPDEDK